MPAHKSRLRPVLELQLLWPPCHLVPHRQLGHGPARPPGVSETRASCPAGTRCTLFAPAAHRVRLCAAAADHRQKHGGGRCPQRANKELTCPNPVMRSAASSVPSANYREPIMCQKWFYEVGITAVNTKANSCQEGERTSLPQSKSESIKDQC